MSQADGRPVALITGAARGQGRAHGLHLSERGYDVVLLDVCASVAATSYPPATAEDLAATAAACRELGAAVVSAEIDLRDGPGVRRAVDIAMEQLGRVDVVVSNAGISGFRPFLELGDDDWDDMIGNNLTTAHRVLSAALPYMVRAGHGGSIVLTASVAGVKVIPFEAHYVASKHGLVGLMRALAVELSPYGIRVNAIAPGGVATAMAEGHDLQGIFADEEQSAMFTGSFSPLLPPHIATPEEVAEIAGFLCSKAARAITGHVMPVDFGVTAR